MNEHPAPRRNLADYILEKRNEKEGVMEEQLTNRGVTDLADILPGAVEMYKTTGELLRTYKTGPLPQSITLLPRKFKKYFEPLLEATDPSSWSSAAVYAISRCWVSNLTDEELRIFYRL